MPEESLSAFAAMQALRDELRARLDQNEDYRAWKALDEVLRELAPHNDAGFVIKVVQESS
jgi:spore coat polysaccharide biosynthesis protein SpsF (cytidylyltransferase family)